MKRSSPITRLKFSTEYWLRPSNGTYSVTMQQASAQGKSMSQFLFEKFQEENERNVSLGERINHKWWKIIYLFRRNGSADK